ncbi:MAG: peptide chain release factor N(5)-glutamine methyltransferase [Armatimonadetes bacterium]|nr:peptide chain release factor N(5)-glutamine methyltransferase [Armatimonadota bacterium]
MRTTTVAEALDEGAALLREARPRTPRLDAEVLLAHVLGSTRTALYAAATRVLPEPVVQEYRVLLENRRRGVPVAYLVGWKEFYSRRFWVSPAVLIPRPESEVLMEEGLRSLARDGLTRARILDLCTGSGALGITLALECPSASVVCTDIDYDAVAQAAENVRLHHVESRVELRRGDLFEALAPGEKFDLILCNPPYVGTDLGPRPEEAVARNEPAVALYAGRDGLDVIRRLVAEAPGYLVERGTLITELAPFQSERVEAWMIQRGLRKTRLLPDLAGLPRAVAGVWEER